MQIEYIKKNVYGLENIYVKDQKIAEYIRILTHKKTISPSDMKALEFLGCEFIQVIA